MHFKIMTEKHLNVIKCFTELNSLNVVVGWFASIAQSRLWDLWGLFCWPQITETESAAYVHLLQQQKILSQPGPQFVFSLALKSKTEDLLVSVHQISYLNTKRTSYKSYYILIFWKWLFLKFFFSKYNTCGWKQ